MDKHLHIVTHEIPWPVDYGGVADLFYKIQTLHSLGVTIHLHCFTSKRGKHTILENYCESVSYYPRKKNLSGFSLSTPYIVQSRRSDALLAAITQDHYPILLEGIHCTSLLQKNKLQNRKVYVRLHNVEYKYYAELAKLEKNVLKKIYFLWESRLLKSYEKRLATKAKFLAVSQADIATYQQEFNVVSITFLPVFLPWNEIKSLPGKGNFCLYHGNLSINENEKAIVWLVENVFTDVSIPLIIAGKNPSSKLLALAGRFQHLTIVADPAEDELHQLIQNAQLHVLPSFNSTGIKLKLLNALFNGRHCLVNNAAVKGSGLEDLCIIAETAEKYKEAVATFYQEIFTPEHIRRRSDVLKANYENHKNGNYLLTLIW